MSDECHGCTLHSLPKRQISAKEDPAAAAQRAPFVHRIFFLGLLFGFFGSAYLGVHLWLILHGAMQPWQNYLMFRSLHASIQLYLFFGLFVTGFAFQAGPSFLGVRRNGLRAVRPIAGAVLLGNVLAIAFPLNPMGMLICGGGFLGAAGYFGALLRFAQPERAAGFGIFIVLGFICLAIGAFIQGAESSAGQAVSPLLGLFILWGGIGSFVFGAGQKFISGSVGGRQLNRLNGAAVFLFHIITALAILFAGLDPLRSDFYLYFSTASALTTLACYAVFTKLYLAPKTARSRPVALALAWGFFWALAGAAALGGAVHNADLILHTWALGWFFTLIIAVSTQVIGHLSAKEIIKPRTLLWIIWLWQLAPLGRGFGHTLIPQLHWLTTAVISVVLIIWAAALLRGIAAIELNTFKRHKILAKQPQAAPI